MEALSMPTSTLEGHHPDGKPVYACKSAGYSAEWQRKVFWSFLLVFLFVIPTLLIASWYSRISWVVWQHSKEQTESENLSSLGTLNPDGSGLQVPKRSGAPALRRSCNASTFSKAKIKTIKMTVCIVLSFVICWCPYYVVQTLHVFWGGDVHVPRWVQVLSETLPLLNSVMNPILYGCFHLRLRQNLGETCCPQQFRQNRSPGGDSCNIG
ncbi:unnamed protein product, partial [Darwinula stevensoni]